METAKILAGWGCTVVVAFLIVSTLVGITAPFWLAPIVGAVGWLVGADHERVMGWYGIANPLVTLAILGGGALLLRLLRWRDFRRTVGPGGGTLSAIVMRAASGEDEENQPSE